MGVLFSIGFYPIDGYILPKGLHNMFPDFMRPYIPTFKNTYSPLFSYYDFSRPDLMPLGIKLFPDRFLISQKRKIYNAIVKFQIKDLEKLLEKESENSKICNEIILDDFQLTAMGLACSIGNIEAVHFLLLKGVSVDQRIGQYEKTPLHLAVENNHEIIVKFLLHNGADLSAKDKLGFNSYEKAENRGIYNMKRIIDQFQKKNSIRNDNDMVIGENIEKEDRAVIVNKDIMIASDNIKNPSLLDLKKQKNLTYEQIKIHKEILIEDFLSPNLENFKPSDMLEINMSNIASKNFAIYDADDNVIDEHDKINVDSFNFYTVNIPAYDRVIKDVIDENGFKINNKIVRYDDLMFAKI